MVPVRDTGGPRFPRRGLCRHRGSGSPGIDNTAGGVFVLATSLWPPGGVERYSARLVAALADIAGDDSVDVVALWRPRGAATPRGRLVFTGRPPGRRLRLGDRAAVMAAGVAAVMRRRPDAIVVAHPHLAYAGAIVAAVAARPLIVVAHGREVWEPCSVAVRWGLRRAAAVWPVSQFTAREVVAHQGVDAARVRVLHPGVEVPPPSDGARRDPTVLAVARLTTESAYKGIDTLLACWPTVRRSVPDAHLVIVGDGAARARLEAQASAGVRFTGAITDADLADRYATAAVFALPSRARTGPGAEGDGFGLVYVEAALAGLPVVAGEGGAAEAMVDGLTGLKVDPRDHATVAAAIIELLQDREHAAELGRAGHRRAVEEFSAAAFRARVRHALESVT